MVLLLAACSSPVSEPASSTLAKPAIAPTPIAIDAAPGMSEIEARHTLDAMFRDAGFRILNDEPFNQAAIDQAAIEVVLDGYDPEQGVGYEYIDASEVGADVSAEERAALANHGRILVIGDCSLDTLTERAAAFLEGVVTATDAGPGP